MATATLDRSKPLAGRRFRFLAEDTQEAVNLIKEHLGEKAHVLSVKQVKGKGINRFLKSPRLEVIATLPKEEAVEEIPQKAIPAVTEDSAAPAAEASEEQSPESGIEHSDAVLPRAHLATERYEQGQTDPDVDYSFLENRDNDKDFFPYERTGNSIAKLLRNARFDSSLMSRFESSPEWDRIARLPIGPALSELYSLLSNDYRSLKMRPLGKRIAFMGTPSVGKTTALCKQLANEVFVENKAVNVLKIDNEQPNPDDALRVFCDALGVELMRDPVDPETIDRENTLYIDLPGAAIAGREDWQHLQERMRLLEVDTRVLVLNAAYDNDAIKDAYMWGHKMKATHVVFTHLDELPNPTKLWQFLLCGGLTPLFYSHGQNVSSEYSTGVLDFMMEKTFPSALLN